jgi:DNA replication protein DnaC
MHRHAPEPVRAALEDAGPMPFGKIMAEVRDRFGDVEPAPAETVEPAEDAAERQRRQQEAREWVWRGRLPRRYVNASLDALRPQQRPALLRDWLALAVGEDPKALNLLLAGPSRHGKTFGVYALGNTYVAEGGYAAAWSLADLNAALRPDGDDTAYHRATGVGLLVLDDIGREQVSAWTLEQLQRVLDHRNREGLRTASTTNLGYDGLVERYGDPIVQRLLDDCTVLKVSGERIDGGEMTW